MTAKTHRDTHTVWFGGQSYQVSAYPHGPGDTGTIWHVLVGDTWHPVRERRGTEPEHGTWEDVAADVNAWLERNVTR